MHEQTIICRQLFAGHMVSSQPMKRKKKNASNDNLLVYYATAGANPRLVCTLGVIEHKQTQVGYWK